MVSKSILIKNKVLTHWMLCVWWRFAAILLWLLWSVLLRSLLLGSQLLWSHLFRPVRFWSHWSWWSLLSTLLRCSLLWRASLWRTSLWCSLLLRTLPWRLLLVRTHLLGPSKLWSQLAFLPLDRSTLLRPTLLRCWALLVLYRLLWFLLLVLHWLPWCLCLPILDSWSMSSIWS